MGGVHAKDAVVDSGPFEELETGGRTRGKIQTQTALVEMFPLMFLHKCFASFSVWELLLL